MSKHNFNNTDTKTTLPAWSLKKFPVKATPNLINKFGEPHNTRQEAKVKSLKEDDIKRPQVEAFIKDIFRKHHDAEVYHFAPSLLATFSPSDEVDAALGYRLAREEFLFLESYLDQSIESLLSNYLGKNININSITEISNLASSDPESCKKLFAHTTDYLHQQGIEWIVSTGTAVMRVVHRRLGIKAHIIHDVDKSRLGDDKYAWGSFYDDDPKILLINVDQARQSLVKSLNNKNFQ